MSNQNRFFRASIFVALFVVCTPLSVAQEGETTPLPPVAPESLPLGTPQLLPVDPAPPADSSSISGLTPWRLDDVLAPDWCHPTHWFGPEPWDTSIELGINGSQGTNETLSMRAGGYIKRKTDWNKVDLQMVYNQTSADGLQTQNNAQLDGRHDWFLGESPWTIFAATSLLYDEFQAFDIRWAANSGLGYQFIETENVNLIGRIGAGTSREFGGPDERWVPEALLGGEYDYTLGDRQKFYAKADYFPDWEDFNSFRLVTDVGWELLIDAESNLNLKVSVIDRYDSTPNGAEPNLLNYSILLLWKL